MRRWLRASVLLPLLAAGPARLLFSRKPPVGFRVDSQLQSGRERPGVGGLRNGSYGPFVRKRASTFGCYAKVENGKVSPEGGVCVD